MGRKKGLKKWLPLYAVVAMFVVAALVAFYVCGDSINGVEKRSWMWSLGATAMAKSFWASSEPTDLPGLLKAAAMGDRTVIITSLNQAWAAPGSIMDLFLGSFRTGENTLPLLKHLLIIAVDKKAMDRCRSIHPYCFLLAADEGSADLSTEERFMSPGYLALVWKKVDVMLSVLELGYNFLFTDGDVLWLRNPFPHLPRDGDLSVSCDDFNGNATDASNHANTGFIHAKSRRQTIEFYRGWLEARKVHPNLHDQAVFDIVKKELPGELGLRMTFMDTVFFGGICQPSRDLNEVCTMHANCCVGLGSKVHDLNIIMEDWNNFRRLPREEKKPGASFWSSRRICR